MDQNIKIERKITKKRNKCVKCNKKPLYGILGAKKRKYCATHALPNHICISGRKCLKCNKGFIEER